MGRLVASIAFACVLALAGCGAATGRDTGSGSSSTGPGPESTDAVETDSDGEPEDTGEDDLSFTPGPQTLPRLTAKQYSNALTDLFGEGLPTVAVEPDTNPYLFYSIGAASTSLSELGTQQYEEAADVITHHVFDDATRRAAVVGCEPASPGDACVDGFLIAFGRRAYRRPLTESEQQRWLSVSVELSEGDPWRGVRLAVAGMLQSPNFVYRVEVGEPDGDRLKYTSWEMASRLSFLLWDTIPDDELLDAAENDDLATAAGVAEQAERLLADPRASGSIQAFFAQYFDLGRLDGVTRDPSNYPEFTPELIAAMRSEVQLIIDDLVYRRDGDVRKVFTTRNTFVNDQLAALYEVDAPDASPVKFVPVELPKNGPRAGLLTLGAFLTMNAHETETSPTLRGKYLRERVLCEEVPAPPDNVDTDLAPGGEGDTLRERLEEHRTNPVCAACHAFIDPPGFLFENFDSLARYRTEEAGHPIDATGDLDGTPLADARDLADALAEDERVGACIVRQLFRHATGRLDVATEGAALVDLHARFGDVGYRFRDFLVELVSHESFRFVTEQEEPE